MRIISMDESCELTIKDKHMTASGIASVILEYPTYFDVIEKARVMKSCGDGRKLIIISNKIDRRLLDLLLDDYEVFDSFPGDEELGKGSVSGSHACTPRFTAKEEAVIKEMGFAMGLGEIAASLGLSARSIRRINEKLLEKTRLESTKQLYLFAFGYISIRSSSHTLGME